MKKVAQVKAKNKLNLLMKKSKNQLIKVVLKVKIHNLQKNQVVHLHKVHNNQVVVVVHHQAQNNHIIKNKKLIKIF